MSAYMERCVGIWIVVAAFVQIAATKPNEPTEAMELARLETVWNNAHLHGDADALDQLWADDLVVTVPKMSVMAKAAALGFLRSGHMKLLRYDTSDLRTRIYGDAAVVTGRLQRTRSMNGHPINDDWRFIKVYVRREGRWQVVAWQASESA